MAMMTVDVNWLAVLGGIVISMVLGFIWYMPAVFGAMWMKETGKSKMETGSAGMSYLVMAVGAGVMTYVMAHFIAYAGASTVGEGAVTAIWLWLGFAAATGIGKSMFQGTSMKLFFIDYGFNLVQFILVGMLLVAWK